MKFMEGFPREIGIPERILINNKQDFYQIFNKFNYIKSKIYFSLYDKNNNIDKICFDLDNDNSLKNLKIIHSYCKEKNIKHLMIFSTKGFWIYIFTKNYENLINKRETLKNVQLFILKQCNIDIKEVDNHILGDIQRLARLPMSYDTKRHLYCIPLIEQDLLLGYDFIKEKAKQQIKNFTYYGLELFDIKSFDNKCDNCFDLPVLNYNNKLLIEKDTFLKTLPLCLAQVLIRGDAHWKERFFIIIYLRESGVLKNECYEIFKQFMNEDKYKIDIIKERQIEYVYNRVDLVMANQETLIKEGICGSWCSHQINKIYK